MKRAFVKKLSAAVIALTAVLFCFLFRAQAAMSTSDIKENLSSYSHLFTKTEDGTLYMEYDKWDISEKELCDTVSDIAFSLIGERVEDFCRVQIKFYYTDGPYGRDFQTFGENMFRVKKQLGNFWTDWSRYNNMEITVTSYNRVCDKFSTNVTLELNGSIDGKKGEAYDEKLLSLVAEAEKKYSDDMDKVQFYLRWLEENASYNILTGFTNDPYYALIKGSTVCGGYANAFKDLCNASGIAATVAVNQQLNHAWSQVYVDGKWYSADLCNVVKSKSDTYNGLLFRDPDTPYDCEDFVREYRDEYVESFNLAKGVSIGSCKITYTKSLDYTGKRQLPQITVKYKSKKLRDGVDYTVSYTDSRYPGEHSFTVTAVKGRGYRGGKSCSYKIVLPAPEKLTASAGKTSVRLRWDKVKAADKYIVRLYDTKSKKYKELGRVENNTCLVKKLEAGRNYTFTVCALTENGSKSCKSSYSKVKVITEPPKVKGVKASSVKDSSFRLKWNKASGAEKYEIYTSTDKKKWTLASEVKGSSVTLKKLKSNKKYYVRVRAVNSSGKGSYSSVISVTTLLPAPEISLKALTGKIRVSYERLKGADGYVIYYSVHKDMYKPERVTVKKGKAGSTVLKSLKKKKTYYIEVRAYKTVKGEKVYGTYTKAMKIKTK